MFKLLVELRDRGMEHVDFFNSCDTTGDGLVDLKELDARVESLDLDLKTKEVHALLSFLDIDKNHHVQKDEFLRQMRKGEALMRQKQDAMSEADDFARQSGRFSSVQHSASKRSSQ